MSLSVFISIIMPTFNRVRVSAIVRLLYTARRIGTWLALQAAPHPASVLPAVLLHLCLQFYLDLLFLSFPYLVSGFVNFLIFS